MIKMLISLEKCSIAVRRRRNLCMLKTPLAYTQENSVCFSIHSI